MCSRSAAGPIPGRRRPTARGAGSGAQAHAPRPRLTVGCSGLVPAAMGSSARHTWVLRGWGYTENCSATCCSPLWATRSRTLQPPPFREHPEDKLHEPPARPPPAGDAALPAQTPPRGEPRALRWSWGGPGIPAGAAVGTARLSHQRVDWELLPVLARDAPALSMSQTLLPQHC